jgi:ElaB/YqjD/DUF883 family membrane-anchored ribosome-binding protein
MADNAYDNPTFAQADADNDDTIAVLQAHMAQMRDEISSLKRSLHERAEEAVDSAETWLDTASDTASRATGALRAQAQTVSSAVQDNPGTVSSALFVGGVIGLLIGLALGRSQPDRRWYERH